MAIPVYTKSPLGLIPTINFVYGETEFSEDKQKSMFSSNHILRKTVNKSPLGVNPLTFDRPDVLHTDDVYNISTSNIIKQLESIPAMRLKSSDFAYCRDYGVYPNNRLLICRRFNNPVLDDLTFYGLDNRNAVSLEPISTLITWFDDSKNILEFSFGEQWIDADVSFKEVLNNAGDDAGLGKVGIKLGDELSKGMLAPSPGATEILQRRLLKTLGIIKGDDTSSEIIPSGTPNLIKEARQRKLIPEGTPGSGLKGKFKITVNCAWEQKFISGIDPTFMYYDILRTVLSFGGSDAVFYLGKRSNLGGLGEFFQNYIKEGPLPQIRKVLDQLQDAIGEITNKIKATMENLIKGLQSTDKKSSDKTGKKAKTDQAASDAEKVKAEAANANTEKTLIQTAIDKFKDFITSFADTLIKKYRVAILGIVSALTGLPSTPWHITVGNPLRPILTSGDMLCEDVDIKLGSQLSFNDLPSNIECSFTLTSARNLGVDEIFEKLSNAGLRTSEDPATFWNTENAKAIEESKSNETNEASQNKQEDIKIASPLETKTKIGNISSGRSINPDANSAAVMARFNKLPLYQQEAILNGRSSAAVMARFNKLPLYQQEIILNAL